MQIRRSRIGGEKALWTAVILSASVEADGNILDTDRRHEQAAIKRQAIKWLTKPSKSFYKVCELADISCEGAERLMKKFQDKHNGRDKENTRQ